MDENILSPIKKWAEKHNKNCYKLKTGLAGFHCPLSMRAATDGVCELYISFYPLGSQI